MPKAARHHILYDVERWRRYRTWLLLPATVFAMTSLFLTILKPTSGGAFGYALVSAVLYAVASSLWTRQRFTYLSREDDRLVVRTMASTRELRGRDIERARVVRLSAVFHRSDRRHLLPRPVDRWLSTDALVVRLQDSADQRGLRRLLGARCLVDDQLVVPVEDPGGLLAEVQEHVAPPRPVISGASGRRRGRRR